MNRPPWNRPAGWLWLVVVLYLALATAYAVYTPAWQAPDEPAHYNYVRYLAEEHRFPVLKAGDFPAGGAPWLFEAEHPDSGFREPTGEGKEVESVDVAASSVSQQQYRAGFCRNSSVHPSRPVGRVQASNLHVRTW